MTDCVNSGNRNGGNGQPGVNPGLPIAVVFSALTERPHVASVKHPRETPLETPVDADPARMR